MMVYGYLPVQVSVVYDAELSHSRQSLSKPNAPSEPPPKHIRNAPTQMMKDQGYGADYAYDHDAPDGFSGQDYFPDGVKRGVHYVPVDRGFERELKKRVDYFAKLRTTRNRN